MWAVEKMREVVAERGCLQWVNLGLRLLRRDSRSSPKCRH